MLLLAAATAGCTDLFFHPSRPLYRSPADLGLAYRDVRFEAADGTMLHGWFLPADGEPQATLVHLHGNAENISTHLGFVAWLPAEGVNVLTIDYRGYGGSGGTPSLSGVHQDAEASFAAVLSMEGVAGRPVGVFGQSLGGSVAITALARSPLKSRFCLLVIDSAFASYRRIIRDKLAEFPLTRPLQGLLSSGIDNGFDPVEEIATLAPMPVLILHGGEDQVVPVAHARALFAAAGEPKQLWVVHNAGHIQVLANAEIRTLLVDSLRGCRLSTHRHPPDIDGSGDEPQEGRQ